MKDEQVPCGKEDMGMEIFQVQGTSTLEMGEQGESREVRSTGLGVARGWNRSHAVQAS